MKTVINTLLYILGAGDNPIPSQRIKSPADATRMAWQQTGQSIRQAISQYAQTSH